MSLPARLLIALLLILAALATGWLKGREHEQLLQQAQQLQIERQAHQDFTAAVKRGNDAARDLAAQRTEMRDRYWTLNQEYKRARNEWSLTAASSGVQRTVTAACPGGGSGTVIVQLPPPGGDEHPLSLGAVWMWNSALAGRDVPAGACGSADTSASACAARSGLTVDDAWDNHTENAARCAEDRLNHQRLIDFLNSRNKGQP